MRVAIFHNFMDNIGGAERVGLTLARELDADFYTTNIDQSKIEKMGFSDVRLKSIGTVPLNAPWRQQIALWKFRQLNLKKEYDFFIIDGDWAMSGAVNHQPNLWYVHSPIREIWDLYQHTRQHTVPKFLRWPFDVWTQCNRHLNRRYVQSVSRLVCNSQNTQNRVRRFLEKDAVVIHPPVETDKFYYGRTGDYWLSVNRLIGHKRIDVQMEAFRRLPDEKLIIVGSYEQSGHFKKYAERMHSIKPANVEILSWVDQEKLIELYANCKAFITTANDEDFGMAPVEAMASGKPVIAPNEGGYRETVLPGVTGCLINQMTTDKLIEAILEVGRNPLQYKEACLEQARKFDTVNFINLMKKEMQEVLIARGQH